MDSVQDQSEGTENLADEVMESVGVKDEGEGTENSVTDEAKTDPLYVQKRLKQQKRSHEREIRELHAKIGELQNSNTMQQPSDYQAENPYADQPQAGGVDEQIHRAVSYALGHKDREERKAKDAERVAYVHRQLGELNKHLDGVSDKYDDFDDVVRGQTTPFTTYMRDASLTLPRTGKGSAGEVLYSLGKSPEELKRISQLHPLDQMSEMVKLSHALMAGNDKTSSPSSKPLGNVKSNPVTNSASITEKTSVSEIRKRMQSGRKWA